MIDLSIIIPVYNNCNYTRKALEGLSKLRISHEVIIVDNGSSDDTEKIVSSFNVKYIKNEENLGFSRANNIGYKQAQGKYILFLNNDIDIRGRHEDWPQILMDACGDGLVGTQGGLLNRKFKFMGEGPEVDPMVIGAYLSGWCILAKKETFDKLIKPPNKGPWDGESFFLYFEDGDLSWRAKVAGIPLKIASIPVHHYSRVTGKKYNMFYYFKKSQRIFKRLWPEII